MIGLFVFVVCGSAIFQVIEPSFILRTVVGTLTTELCYLTVPFLLDYSIDPYGLNLMAISHSPVIPESNNDMPTELYKFIFKTCICRVLQMYIYD